MNQLERNNHLAELYVASIPYLDMEYFGTCTEEIHRLVHKGILLTGLKPRTICRALAYRCNSNRPECSQLTQDAIYKRYKRFHDKEGREADIGWGANTISPLRIGYVKSISDLNNVIHSESKIELIMTTVRLSLDQHITEAEDILKTLKDYREKVNMSWSDNSLRSVIFNSLVNLYVYPQQSKVETKMQWILDHIKTEDLKEWEDTKTFEKEMQEQLKEIARY